MRTLRDVMADHFPVEVRCDHEAKTDQVVCDCALVALPIMPSVLKAKQAWADHVLQAALDEGATVPLPAHEGAEQRPETEAGA